MTEPAESFVASFMERVLETIVEKFAEKGVELPGRRYIFFGMPAADCAQLTVALQQLYLGPPGLPASEPTPCNAMTSAVLRIELLREVPIPGDREMTVPVAKLTAAANQQILDAEILLDALEPMCGATWGGMGVFADVSMGTEQGMYAGPVMNLTAGVP